jgi:transcriptional/translational regulatory protein YebC/TACO1
MILLESFGGDEEALWECALEAGATEVDIDNQSAMITCEPADLWSLVASLRDNAYEPAEFEHRYVVTDPSTVVLLNEEGQEKLESFLDKMDEDEDITNVYHNSTSQLWEV